MFVINSITNMAQNIQIIQRCCHANRAYLCCRSCIIGNNSATPELSSGCGEVALVLDFSAAAVG